MKNHLKAGQNTQHLCSLTQWQTPLSLRNLWTAPNHLSFVISGPPEGFDAYPHADILNDSYRKWNNEFRAPNEEKIQIPKIFTPYGFK